MPSISVQTTATVQALPQMQYEACPSHDSPRVLHRIPVKNSRTPILQAAVTAEAPLEKCYGVVRLQLQTLS